MTKAVFNSDWLKDEVYSSWIQECKKDRHSAFCFLCKKTVSLSNMGVQALKSHMAGKKHRMAITSRISTPSIQIFTQVTATMPTTTEKQALTKLSDISNNNPDDKANRIVAEECQLPKVASSNSNPFLLKDSVTKAEILWALNTVRYHFSMSAAGQSTELFHEMFPDSKIAQDMKLQRNKLTYIIVYGLGPFFRGKIESNVTESEFFAISFDETLNKIAQEEQMDLIVRYWCNIKNTAVCRYLGSAFLGRTRATDLLAAFKEQLAVFDLKKMIQVSMDGPNVNLKFLDDLKKDLYESPNDPQLLDMGSCGIHTLHNAFRVGFQSSGWKIIDFLRATYNLFKNVPARRADYIRFSGSRDFPKKFCGVRWLQNVKVVQRAQNVLPNLVKYVKGVRDEKKEPKSGSYATITHHLDDKNLCPKLAFFQSLAAEIEPYLAVYQNDQPMVPFLYTDMTNLLRILMDKFVKKEILDKEIITKIDVHNKENLIDVKQIDLGYDTRDAIRKSKNLSQKDILLFRKDCLLILQKITSKILEKSPIKYKIVKAVTFCDPQIISQSETVSFQRLKVALENFIQQKRLNGRTADKIDRDFRELCSKAAIKDSFKTFLRNKDRLDSFWMEMISMANGSEELKIFLQMIFVLFHGNANVERGFSVNKECLIENQSQRTLVALKHVWDELDNVGGVKNVCIDKKMIHAARNARSRYMENLEEQKKKDKDALQIAENRKRSRDIIKELNEKKRKLATEYQRSLDSLDEQLSAAHQK